MNQYTEELDDELQDLGPQHFTPISLLSLVFLAWFLVRAYHTRKNPLASDSDRTIAGHVIELSIFVAFILGLLAIFGWLFS